MGAMARGTMRHFIAVGRRAAIAASAILLLAAVPARAQLQRIEIVAVPSVTLEGEQFLTGEHNGKPVTLAGELRLPASGAAKLPVVVLVQGSGGIGPSTDRWAWEINGIGVAAFILDSFTGRGITSTVADQTQLNSLAMTVDAYRALALLAEHPRVDKERIAVMGFSKGAVAALYSSLQRFHEMHGPPGLAFAAHIGFYTPCNVAYRDDTHTTGKPIRLFHGSADDYVAIGPCRAYAERLRQAGVDITLTEYEGAQHAFDNFTLPPLREVASGQTTRNCRLVEGENGVILNAKTGRLYDIRADRCVERGPHVGYDQAAHEASVAAVTGFLKTTFGLP
jgi:dienelactone hydrolase